MAGDNGSPDRALIAGCRHDQDPATHCKIEGVLKMAPTAKRWALQGNAQIDDPRDPLSGLRTDTDLRPPLPVNLPTNSVA